MKKLIALVLALAMVLMVGASFATSVTQSNLTITINSESTGRVYNAYQIFTGSISSNSGSNRTLGNIEWGTGVNSTAIINALTGSGASDMGLSITGTGASNAITAADVANALVSLSGAQMIKVAKIFETNKGTATAYPSGTATGSGPYAYTITGLNAGYYIVVDNTTLGDDDAASAIVLNVVGDTTVNEKVSKPGVDKAVEGATDTYNTTYADHAINESFKFKLTATLTSDSDYAAYDAYKVEFTDTPSTGITYESIYSVVIAGKNSSDQTVSTTVDAYDATEHPAGYHLSGGLITAPDGDGLKTLVVTINDLKTTSPTIDLTKGATVTVIYNAHLNADAEVEPVTETNGYTDNKNTVKLKYSNNPTTGGEGETTTDDVYVFTFELDNTKWAGPGTKVTDADKITELNGKGVNKWEDKTNNKYYVKSGSDWYEMAPLSGAGFTLYSDSAKTTAIKLIDNNDGTYTVANQAASSGYVTEMKSATSGKFDVKGLNQGTYYLAETTTPPGYNTAADVTVTISATHADYNNRIAVTVNSTNADNEIVDNSGTQLPSTGGIGTTIFYILGGLLVVGAAVILVARRKASN